MRMLIAPTAYKGTLSPLEAARAIIDGIQFEASHVQSEITLELFPISDGGNGWLEAWAFHTGEGVEWLEAEVRDPLGRPIQAPYLILPDHTAVIESALACGLHLLFDEERDPMHTGTEGVGDLIRHACDRGVDRIYLGLGGSATNDAGTGALRALGFEFMDEQGMPIPPGGEGLLHLARIVSPPDVSSYDGKVICCCDVNNRLYGNKGAARVFAPQKGANPQQVRLLNEGLRRFAETAKRDLGVDLSRMKRAGAAGGLTAGLRAGLKAVLTSGTQTLLKRFGFEDRLSQADVLVTGEGRIDAQTGMGKGVGILILHAAIACEQVWVLPGSVGEGWEAVTDLPAVRVYAASELFPHTPPYEALKSTAQLCFREHVPREG